MKRILLSILIFPLIFAACKDDGGIGLSIQPQGDEIKVVVDTFYIAAQDSALIAISAQCSDSLSMLLGEYYSEKYGSTKAELIVQIAPPLDYTFPDEAINNPTVDSLVMLMLYRHWFGSKREPLEISIYKMDNKSPEYSKQYFTDFPISDFSTKSTLLGTTIMTSIDQTLDDSITSASGYIPSIRYKFNNDLAQDLFNVTKAGISSTQDFLENFKGVYITTTYGQSTMLYLQGIEMRLFYHYNYEKNGVDTVVNTYIRFPANKEVRQLNKITHVNTENVVNQYDSVSYLKTGGGIYPKITIPLAKINQHKADSIGGKIFTINSAILSVEATEIDSSKNAIPVPTNVMLLPKAGLEYFLTHNKIATGDTMAAVFASYNSTKKEYTFDIARLLNAYVGQNAINNKGENNEPLELMLIPVDIISYNGSVSEIRPQKTIGAATIRTSQGNQSLRLELIYCGF